MIDIILSVYKICLIIALIIFWISLNLSKEYKNFRKTRRSGLRTTYFSSLKLGTLINQPRAPCYFKKALESVKSDFFLKY